MGRNDERTVWGPDDWDAWIVSARDDEGPDPVEAEFVHDLLTGIPGRRSMTIADLGCGRGDWLEFLSRHFGQVVAVDYAPVALAAARRSCREAGIIFRRRDLRDLAPLHGCLHVALALESVLGPTVDDVDRVFSEVHACLIEGGLFVATFPARPAKGKPVPMPLAGFPAPHGPLRFSEVDLQYRLRRAGFRGVRIRRIAAGVVRGDLLLCVAARRADN
jgi:SAM-dependent methyltransferase